jgi:hypothetical protein
MPEYPDDDYIYASAERLRIAEEKAAAYDEAVARAQRMQAQGHSTAEANIAAGLTAEGHTVLEPGESDFQQEAGRIATGAVPPAQDPPLKDAYVESEELFNKALADGAPEPWAAATVLNRLANRAAAGDQSVILPAGGGVRPDSVTPWSR